MSAVGTLESIEATFGYLKRPGDASVLVDNAAAFTRHAAWALRAEGWGNVRKTSGLQRHNLDVDKILNRHTLEMVDIVIAAGDASQRIGWQPQGTGTPAQFVEPEAPAGVDGGEKPPDDDVDELAEAVLAAFAEVKAAIEAHHETSKQILAILERAAGKFGV